MGTVLANFLPNTTGLDLGSTTQQWDAFVQNLTLYGTLTAPSGISLAGNLTLTSGNLAVSAGSITASGNITTTAGNVLPNAANTTQSLGTSSAAWDAVLQDVTTGTLNGIAVVDGIKFTTIQAAVNFFASGNGIVYVPTGTYTLSSQILVSQANITIWCAPDAVIRSNFAANPNLQLAASGCHVIGGIWDGNQPTGTNTCIDLFADNCSVDNAVIKNAAVYGVYISGATNCAVRNCRISACQNIAVFGENNAIGCQVSGNYVDQTSMPSGAHCIAFHSTTGGKNVDRALITGNTCLANGANSFGIEVGAFSGDTPKGIAICNNTVKAVGTCSGGISTSTTSAPSVVGNTFDSNAQTISICGIEQVLTTDGTTQGNTVLGGSGLAHGIVLDRCSRTTVVGNTVKGFAIAVVNSGIHVIAGNTGPTANDNIIAENVIQFTTAGGGRGIWIQANFAGATTNTNSVRDNRIDGVSSTAGGIGILIEVDTGTASTNAISNNLVNNCALEFSDSGGTGTIIGNSVARVDLTAQTAAIGTTTLYTVPTATPGQYRLSWNTKTTTAAGTSSTLGPLTIVYTDPDGVAVTLTAAAAIAAGTIATTSTANTTGTVLIGMPMMLNCKANTVISYATGYASNAANVMAYNLHIALEKLSA